MIIRTDEPIIQHREQITRQIAQFWDQISGAWRKVWGEHIHHGYFEENDAANPKTAQVKLIEKILEQLNITQDSKILDAGCGMGGSSLYLHEKYNAEVTGITLSPRQAAIATQQAQKRHFKDLTFLVEDALSMPSLPNNAFDLVWSLESCEQMFDKALFIQQAFRVLKPGGQFMLATWCSDQEKYEGKLAKDYKKLCLALDLPSMPTAEKYQEFLALHHFQLVSTQDWSAFVKKSWALGLSLVNAYSFLSLLLMGGWRGFRFTKQAKLMRDAFEQGRVRYLVFVAKKPL